MRRWRFQLVLTASAAWLSACVSTHDRARAPYVPIEEVEAIYGPLVAAGNHPTADQHGSGERIGLFQDANNTIWGLPLLVKDGAILACAPVELRDTAFTDSFNPPYINLIAATNAPTGWRGGSGELELLIRDAQGAKRSQVVHGAEFPSGPVCWAPDLPGPPQPLRYYRLAGIRKNP